MADSTSSLSLMSLIEYVMTDCQCHHPNKPWHSPLLPSTTVTSSSCLSGLSEKPPHASSQFWLASLLCFLLRDCFFKIETTSCKFFSGSPSPSELNWKSFTGYPPSPCQPPTSCHTPKVDTLALLAHFFKHIKLFFAWNPSSVLTLFLECCPPHTRILSGQLPLTL